MAASSHKTWLGILLFLALAGGAGWWCYQQYFAIDMTKVTALNDRGLEHIELFEFDKAVSVFQEVVKLAPNWEPGKTNLQNALSSRDVKVDMAEVIELNNRGIGWIEMLEKGGGYKNAVPIFEEVTKKAPAWTPGYINLGIALLNRRVKETGDIDRAQAIFERILKSDPKNSHANF